MDEKVKRVCWTCRDYDGENNKGRCTRYPPKHYEAFGLIGTSGTRWPVVNVDDSCGEWRKK